MNARYELDQYLTQARQRLRWILSAQGTALLVGALLLVTLIAAWMLPRYGFTPEAALTGRIVLGLVAIAILAWIFWRYRVQERDRAARALESALPAQSGRIATYLQESAKEPEKASVLLDLLAADALSLAQREPLTQSIPVRRYLAPAIGAVAGVALLGVLVFSNLGISEGARQLWLGRMPPAVSVAAAAGGIAVQPGDATIRRNQDLDVAALVAGSSDDVQLHVRFDNGGEWESTPMQRNPDGGFGFTIYAVRDAASYYVTAGRLKSAEHRINVVDLPGIERFKITYDYPTWTGLEDREEEGGGDVRAVAGTRVKLEVTTTQPLESPLLVIDGNGEELKQSGATTSGSFQVKQEGHYRIATRFLGEVVPLTPDYLIEVVEDQKPEIRIVRPGRDYRATALEEVPVRIEARDDFRLDALELHYSVNGGEWRKERLPAGTVDVQAAALLRLEEMQKPGPNGETPTLVPGDLVSYYGLARDNKHSVQTDLFLIQVQPFEQRYTQSQAGGGGGGGGGGGDEEEGDISRRQREILLATWNLQRNEQEAGAREKERVADNARMLAEMQQTLAGQAQTLIERARARQLTGQDQNVDTFVRAVQDAAKAMAPAAKNLASVDLANAVTHEQQALQHLLRAEAAFREISVAMQQPGGGGGGGGQAGRDVSEMTELELDLAKNQYETESRMSSSQQRAQAEDEAARRLRELARRQEQLARQSQRQQIPPETQRWQQEQLRRELEQLRRELEQLANNQGSQGQQSSSQQGGQQNPQQQGQQQGQQGRQGQQQQQASRQNQGQSQQGQQQGGQQSGQQSARAASAAEASRQVAEALRQMDRAGNDPQAQARAAEQLNRAREQLEQGRQAGDSEQFQSLANRARQLAEQQRRAEEDLRAVAGNGQGQQQDSGLTFDDLERLAQQRAELQRGLGDLTQAIESARRSARETAPRAARQLADVRQQLQEQDPAGSIGLSVRQISRGRVRDAAGLDWRRTQVLERVAQDLEQAAQTASAEVSQRRQQAGQQASAEDLLAEMADVRRMLDQAREQGLSQNRSGGDRNTSSPNAQEGPQGQQSGGQQGQQGQGGQGQQQGQQGGSPGEQQTAQSGAQGGAQGGFNDGQFFGGGNSNRSGDGLVRLAGGGNREPVPLIDGGMRQQAVISAERLAQLREQLRGRVLTDADARTLQELTNQLRRGGTDPMDVQYQRMQALVNQIELAALNSIRAGQTSNAPTRATETVDDSRQYRDNVAEYYRRLGGGND